METYDLRNVQLIIWIDEADLSRRFYELQKNVYIISLFGDSNFALLFYRIIKYTANRALSGISDMLQRTVCLLFLTTFIIVMVCT
jgi:hypothetical protein